MAVTSYFYANALLNAFTRAQTIDGDTSTLKVMLTDNNYTPNQDTHSDKADVTNEISGTGYTAGGATLTGVTWTLTNNVLTFDANNPSWAGSTITNARRAVYYDDSGATDADKALICWVDFGEDKSTSSATFQITIPSTGIATITATNASGFP